MLSASMERTSPAIASFDTVATTMSFDEGLAERIRAALESLGHKSEEKRMFGGIAWLFDGAMGIGIAKNKFMVRVGPAAYEAALSKPHVKTMDFTGRALRGYVYVDDEGLASDHALCEWVNVGATFAKSVAAEELAPSNQPRAKGVTKGSKKSSKKSSKKGSTKAR